MTKIEPSEYKPDYAVPPGETITEILEMKLARDMNITPEDMHDIITGDKAITDQMATGLAICFRVPKTFWLNLEANYRRNLARLKDGEESA